MRKYVSLITLITLWFIITGCSWWTTEPTSEPSMEVQDVQQAQKANDRNTSMWGYKLYDAWEVTKDQFEDRKSILFFYDETCASCESLHNNIISNATSIPENVHIYSVNLEEQSSLVNKYRIQKPHSIVIVHDKNNFTTVQNLTTLDQILNIAGTQTITIK